MKPNLAVRLAGHKCVNFPVDTMEHQQKNAKQQSGMEVLNWSIFRYRHSTISASRKLTVSSTWHDFIELDRRLLLFRVYLQNSVPYQKRFLLNQKASLTLKNPWHYNNVIMGTIASQITSLMIVYSTLCSDADQRKKKTSKLRVTGHCVTDEFPAQMASNAENVTIWWRHHDKHQWMVSCLVSHLLQAYQVLPSLCTLPKMS